MKAEFIWALPPAANDSSPFGGGDHIAGYAPLALVAENESSQLELYWVHGNHLGVPVVTTNASGQVVSPANDFLRPGFPGQSQVLSDLYYNRARDYDPITGRYIQADPIGLAGDVNPYVYALSDPVNLIDPLGEAALLLPLVTGGGNLAYQLYWNGGQLDCVDWWQVGEWALAGTGFSGVARGGVAAGGWRQFLRHLARDERGGVQVPHGNSLKYIGETHVYAIRGPNGIHKIGESMRGVNRNGLSRRGEAQARRLSRKTNDPYRSRIRKTFPNKRDARRYERRLIERYRRMYGDSTLLGNRTNR